MNANSRRGFLTLGAGFLASAIFAAQGEAREKRVRRRRQAKAVRPPPVEEEQPVAVAPRVCRPMCATDMSPCDPPQMKTLDGRCSNPISGPVF